MTRVRSYCVELALNKGLGMAIVDSALRHLIHVNKKIGVSKFLGRTWVYGDLQYLSKHIPELTPELIKHNIQEMIKSNMIKVGSFSENDVEWYTYEQEVEPYISTEQKPKTIHPMAEQNRVRCFQGQRSFLEQEEDRLKMKISSKKNYQVEYI